MFRRANSDFSYAKWMSERRSRERSTCLACKVFICVSHQKVETSFARPELDGAIRPKQSNMFVSTKSREEICAKGIRNKDEIKRKLI